MQYIIDEQDYAILQKAKDISGKEKMDVWIYQPRDFYLGLSIHTNDESIKILNDGYKKSMDSLYQTIAEFKKKADTLSELEKKWWFKLFSKWK